MFSKGILTFLTTLCILSAYSQKVITYSGHVTESENQETLIGVQIVAGPGIGTVTDQNGDFSIDLAPSITSIEVSYLGYEKQTINLSPSQTKIPPIVMQLSQTTLNEIIVSASQQNFKANVKGSNYRLDPKTITNLNPLNTEEILRTVPGVNIVGDMGLSNRPNISIRGSWGRRSKKVLLLEDGSPSAPAPYVAPGAYYNPVSDRVTAIEVYKGADMLRFGPNNMYGGINYITAMPPQKPELRFKLVGGQRDYRTALFSYGGTWNNLGALVEGVYKSFDGFTKNSSVELLNLNAKIFAKLNHNQSLYFKVSGQFEDNQASLSSITPFTFDQAPDENPFDADQFTMRRYGVDIIHKWIPKKNMTLTSKIYASDFERDWWKQNTTKILASEVENYVGASTFQQRYNYLSGLTFGSDDYVIVGRLNNGVESNTDSRWGFTVSGLKETFTLDWNWLGQKHQLEASAKLHQEVYKDRALASEGSRFSRSGNITKDLKYYLWSASGFVRNAFHYNKWGITPIVRFEYIDMYKQDLLALGQTPGLGSIEEGRLYNDYTVLLPGVTVDYEIPSGELFGSVYRGFIAPSKIFGFLVEQDGVITNPLAGESINMKPELSLNTEIGWRGNLLKQKLDGQLTYFNNTVSNFYAGGRNEIFEELGKINIQGIELGVGALLYSTSQQKLKWYTNATFLQAHVVSGTLTDRDLFSQVIHNDETQQEYVDMVNSNRDAFQIYVEDNAGNEVLLTDEVIDVNDFGSISRSTIEFGDDKVDNAVVPYSPDINLTMGLDYSWKKISVGASFNYVGEQYTEFHNFDTESPDGAIGKLPSFQTLDAYINYTTKLKSKMDCKFFINGKNITDEIYRASRLNRATSGIFPGGFRQIIFGVNLSL